MSIWAIADIHASKLDPITGQPTKPMDIFGPFWVDHISRLERAWRDLVAPNDTVILAGDLDWALHLADALPTLERIAAWNGRKILIRGNHDYWWSSSATGKVRKALPEGIALIHNDSARAEGFNIVGAKGSPVPGGIEWDDIDAKLLNRESERLKLSLASRDPELPTICALHYPPCYPGAHVTPYTRQLTESGSSLCVFGHLHGAAALSAPQSSINGVAYRLVAADYLDFRPALIATDGTITHLST